MKEEITDDSNLKKQKCITQMTLEEFEKDLDAKLNAMSDEELISRLEKAGCVFEKEQEKEKEKVMIKGYKASYDQYCRGYFFEVGKTYELKHYPILCNYGYHFCQKPHDVFHHYTPAESLVLFEINAIGDVVHDYDNSKSCTNKIEIVRIVPKEEYNSLFDSEYAKFDEKDGSFWFKNKNKHELKFNKRGRLIWEKLWHGQEYTYEH
jgi:hypothetical protein